MIGREYSLPAILYSYGDEYHVKKVQPLCIDEIHILEYCIFIDWNE